VLIVGVFVASLVWYPLFLVLVSLLVTLAVLYWMFELVMQASLRPPVPVPEEGLEERIAALAEKDVQWRSLGFRPIDSYLLIAGEPILCYAYQYESRSVWLILSHYPNKIKCELTTYFEPGLSLTTSSSGGSAFWPRPSWGLLQVLENTVSEQLLKEHLRAISLLTDKGFVLQEAPAEDFHELYHREMRHMTEYIRAIPLWPVLVFFRLLLKAGRKYQRSIAEQHRRGEIEILYSKMRTSRS